MYITKILLLVAFVAFAKCAYHGHVDDLLLITEPEMACYINYDGNLHFFDANRAGMFTRHMDKAVYNEMISYQQQWGVNTYVGDRGLFKGGHQGVADYNKKAGYWTSHQRTGTSFVLLAPPDEEGKVDGNVCCCREDMNFGLTKAVYEADGIPFFGIGKRGIGPAVCGSNFYGFDSTGIDAIFGRKEEGEGEEKKNIAELTDCTDGMAFYGNPFLHFLSDAYTEFKQICSCSQIWNREVSAMYGNPLANDMNYFKQLTSTTFGNTRPYPLNHNLEFNDF